MVAIRMASSQRISNPFPLQPGERTPESHRNAGQRGSILEIIMSLHYTYGQFLEVNGISDEERFKECDECDGEGYHECSCGDEHDCKACDGKGKRDIMRDMYDVLCKKQEYPLYLSWVVS